MANVYRGIDIAGDRSPTGLADLVERGDRLHARVYESGFDGDPNVNGLLRVREGETLAGCAIDQPLGFPARTLRLLSLDTSAQGLRDYLPSLWRFRQADSEMRRVLRVTYGLDPDYVLPPVVCDNVWRAMYLLHRAGVDLEDVRTGQSMWCETHPRLAVAALLPADRLDLAENYKYKMTHRGTGEERAEARRWHALRKEATRGACLDLLKCRLPYVVLDRASRDQALGDDNAFEALFCALAAFAIAKQKVRRFPEQDIPASEARLEGYVFIPDWKSLSSLGGLGREPESNLL